MLAPATCAWAQSRRESQTSGRSVCSFHSCKCLFCTCSAVRTARDGACVLCEPVEPTCAHMVYIARDSQSWQCCTAHPLIVVRQRKPFRRKDGLIIYFEDNAGVIVNPKGDLKGAVPISGFWWFALACRCVFRALKAGSYPHHCPLVQALPLLVPSRRSVPRSGPVSHQQPTASFRRVYSWQG